MRGPLVEQEHHRHDRGQRQAAHDERVSPSQPARFAQRADAGKQGDRQQRRSQKVGAARVPGRLDRARHDVDGQQHDDRDRHVEQEDPLPAGDRQSGNRKAHVEEDPRSISGADSHADECGRALEAQGGGACATLEEVGSQAHRERHQRAAAESLDHAGGDQPVDADLWTCQSREPARQAAGGE